MPDPLVLAALFFVAALLYASVGHAGASAYLAIMALLGVPPAVARPTALSLNVVVASFVTVRFWRAGLVSFRAVVPFVLGSVPAAFIGGAIDVPTDIYEPLLGIVLLVSAAGFARTARSASGEVSDRPVHVQPLIGLGAGVAIGLVSGLTGTGGGIFLSPLLILAGWATTRQASGIAAVFILANSLAGLAGNISAAGSVPAQLPLWMLAVLGGALIGAEIGSRRASPPQLRIALALVLVVAGLKLIFVG